MSIRQLGLDLCKAYYGLVLAVGMIYAFVTNPAAYAYDLSLVWVPLAMVVSAAQLWLMGRRCAAARTTGAGMTLVTIVLAALDLASFGGFAVLAGRMGTPFAAAMVALFSAGGVSASLYLRNAAHALLDRPLDLRPTAEGGHSWDMPLRKRVRTSVFWRDIAIYFTSFSFMGHWAEMLFCYGIYLGIFMGTYDFGEIMLWHQWLFPYLAEACAMVLVVVLLHPAQQWLLKKTGGRVLPALLASTAITGAVCVAIDFTAGMICNQDYGVWDYRMMPFNFMGQVCLQNSTVYTVAATLLVWVAYPAMDRYLRRMPRDRANFLCLALCTLFCFFALLHFVYIDASGLPALGMVMKPE